MAVASQAGPVTALRLMRDRNFGPYFLGNASSASGTWFQNLAASLLVYRLTHSAFLLGVLNFCNFIPVLLLAPWAGSAADRFDRRRLLFVTQLGSTVVSAALAGLAWAGLARVWVVIACAVVLGIGSAFAAPASQAFLGDLVTREQLGSAVALNSMTYNLARAIGPALAAVSVRTLGIPASFAINAGSYLLLVLALLVVHPAPRRLALRGEARLRESLRLVRDEPRLLA
jgi:MFS family permease